MWNAFLQNFTKSLKKSLMEKQLGGCTDCKHAYLHKVATVPSLPHGDFWDVADVFWLASLCFLAAVKPWAIFCFIQSQIRRSSWMLALSWEMETICAAMKEAFCVWQGLRAGTSIKRKLGNNQVGCALGAFHCQYSSYREDVSSSSWFTALNIKRKNNLCNAQVHKNEYPSKKVRGRICEQCKMAWVINMVCQDVFPFAHCSSGTGLRGQNKAYFVLPKAPLLYFRGFFFSPEACLREFLALSFKEINEATVLLAFGIGKGSLQLPLIIFAYSMEEAEICVVYFRMQRTPSAPKGVPHPGAEVSGILL